MLDISIAYNRYKFLGYEFLSWLWFMMETGPEKLSDIFPDMAEIEIGNRLVLENSLSDHVEMITIRGDDAGLEEGLMALGKGAVVTELNLIYRSVDHEWRFTLKGDTLNIANLKTPTTGEIQADEDLEGAILEKIDLLEKIDQWLNMTYTYFVKLRISEAWNDEIIPQVRNWIQSTRE